MWLTEAEGEGISNKPRVADTVKVITSRVITDALSTETTGGEVTWICPNLNRNKLLTTMDYTCAHYALNVTSYHFNLRYIIFEIVHSQKLA